jgi:hypothetical protein
MQRQKRQNIVDKTQNLTPGDFSEAMWMEN